MVVVLGGVEEQHFGLRPDHLELLDAPHLRVVALLILEVLLLGLGLALFPEGHDILVKRADVLLLVPDLGVLGPSVDGLVVLRGRDGVAVERVVELEVEEGEDEDGVLLVLDRLELVGAEVVADAVQQGHDVEVLAQGFPLLGTVFAAEVDVLGCVLPLR